MTDLYLRSSDGSDGDNGTTWALAKATLTGVLAIATAADRIFVDSAHVEVLGASTIYTCPETPGLQILSVDDTGSPEPPVESDLEVMTGGWSHSGDFFFSLQGSFYSYGLSFIAGDGGDDSNSFVILGGSAAIDASQIWEKYVWGTLSTHVSGGVYISSTGGNNEANRFLFIDGTISFAATTQTIRAREGQILFRGLTLAGAATPATLFGSAASWDAVVVVEASDLSSPSWSNVLARTDGSGVIVTLRNCKIPAGISLITGIIDSWAAARATLENCDSADTNYRYASATNEGDVTSETTVIRTGGASDGAQGLSYKMATTANPTFATPLESPEIVLWNETVGSSITVTVQIVTDNVTLQDDEIWLEVQYLGTSGFPKSTIISDRMTNALSTPANQASATEEWAGALGVETDQALSVSFQPEEIGFIHAKVMLAKPSQTTYIDPKLTVT